MEKKLDTVKSNKEIKASAFTAYFGEKERAADLYRALVRLGEASVNGGEEYKKINSDDIFYTTLSGVMFMARKNDLAFTVKNKVLVIGEHQSTVNANMPLRDAIYYGRTLEKLIPPKALYKNKQIGLPTPEFYVFYNGNKEQPPEITYKLSDAYLEKTEKPMLELEVKVININLAVNHPLLQECRSVYEYSWFIQRIKDYIGKGYSRDGAVVQAMADCLDEGIMKDFINEHGTEVENMLFTEFNMEDALEVRGEEMYEEGIEKGIKALIETCMELGLSREAAGDKVKAKFAVQKEAAEKYLLEYWK